MFSFFKKKPAAEPPVAAAPQPPEAPAPQPPAHASTGAAAPAASPPSLPTPASATASWLSRFAGRGAAKPGSEADQQPTPPTPFASPAVPPLKRAPGEPADSPAPSRSGAVEWPDARPQQLDEAGAPARQDWMAKLRSGLRKTGSTITLAFTGAQVGDELYEELEAALLQADAGIEATEYLLDDLRWRVKRAEATKVSEVKDLLAEAIASLLSPLERPLRVGEHTPTVIMVVGVNGAGKTTTIGKLTRHLVNAQQKVMLAAADTFRAAAREQLAVWADRADLPGASAGGRVDIVSQQGGDPAGVTFDAVVAAKSRACDVVIADTAGRLTTQLHLMEELKKIRRVITKAQDGAPHEVLLVIDGNTGQNALAQVQVFDAALQLTGLVVTKLDGTAKGGVLAAIALWARSRTQPLAVYFIGVGEKLEDLQTFSAREFADALVG